VAGERLLGSVGFRVNRFESAKPTGLPAKFGAIRGNQPQSAVRSVEVGDVAVLNDRSEGDRLGSKRRKGRLRLDAS
jgi:hypothetical protein